MDTNLYRNNLFLTHNPKAPKSGLRRTAGNMKRTVISAAAMGVVTEVGDLIEVLSPYISGASHWNDELIGAALEEMGDIGYYLVKGAKFLKVKVPGARKKVKLVGRARTTALLELHSIATRIASIVKKNVFNGPTFTADGELDKETTENLEAMRLEDLKSLWADALTLYWQLSFDMFQQPPAYVFDQSMNKLATIHGKIFHTTPDAWKKFSVHRKNERAAARAKRAKTEAKVA